MKFSQYVLVWHTIPALLVGLLIGIGVGRTITPFDFGRAIALDDGTGAQVDLTGTLPTITPETLQRLRQVSAPLVIVDARGDSRYAASRIPGSVSIPLGSSAQTKVLTSPAQMIVVYCELDCDSAAVVRDWLGNRVANIRLLTGGMDTWEQEGYAVDRSAQQ